MNYDWLSCQRRPCRLTLHRSDVGSMRSPIKLFFSQIVVTWTWGPGYLRLGTLGGSTQGTGFKSDLTWKMCGIFWPLIFQSDLQIILLDSPDLSHTREPSLLWPRQWWWCDDTVRQSSNGSSLSSASLSTPFR